MSRQTGKEAIVTRGMSNVLTGLGILLGSGRISDTTHEKILALLNAEECSDTNAISLRPGKETPASLHSNDIEHEIRGLRLTDQYEAHQGNSFLSNPSKFPNEDHRTGVPTATLSHQGIPSGSRATKIVCPWWSTPGYTCREHESGQCSWLHEDVIGGVRDPLICSFWSDGQKCTKTDQNCRFAHYWANHRQIAPAPNAKFKKSKKQKVEDPW